MIEDQKQIKRYLKFLGYKYNLGYKAYELRNDKGEIIKTIGTPVGKQIFQNTNGNF